MAFNCSICGEESTRICVRCTKDACDNHLCEKCLRCSDCCECEVRLSDPPRVVIPPALRDLAGTAIPNPDPEPPLPAPDPEPDPPPVPEDPTPLAP